jgi:hypothetical protein
MPLVGVLPFNAIRRHLDDFQARILRFRLDPNRAESRSRTRFPERAFAPPAGLASVATSQSFGSRPSSMIAHAAANKVRFKTRFGKRFGYGNDLFGNGDPSSLYT